MGSLSPHGFACDAGVSNALRYRLVPRQMRHDSGVRNIRSELCCRILLCRSMDAISHVVYLLLGCAAVYLTFHRTLCKIVFFPAITLISNGNIDSCPRSTPEAFEIIANPEPAPCNGYYIDDIPRCVWLSQYTGPEMARPRYLPHDGLRYR